MTSLALLWLPILLSAVLVFLASSVIHMALPIHKGDYRKLPDEPGTLEALRRTGVVPGQYVFPCPASMQDMGSPEMLARFRQGPVGTMVVRPNGPPAMGTALGQWFAFCIVVSLLVAYLTALTHGPGVLGVFRFAAAAAFLGFATSSVSDSIWKGVSWSTTGRFVFDGLVYALLSGAAFAWLWPAA